MDIHYNAQDIRNEITDSWQACDSLCKAEPVCLVWTWNSGKRCFLKKNGLGRETKTGGYISGKRYCGK